MNKTDINIAILKVIEEIKNKSSYDYSKVVQMDNENFKLKTLYEFMQFMERKTFEIRLQLEDYKLDVNAAIERELQEKYQKFIGDPVPSKNWDRISDIKDIDDPNEPPF